MYVHSPSYHPAMRMPPAAPSMPPAPGMPPTSAATYAAPITGLRPTVSPGMPASGMPYMSPAGPVGMSPGHSMPGIPPSMSTSGMTSYTSATTPMVNGTPSNAQGMASAAPCGAPSSSPYMLPTAPRMQTALKSMPGMPPAPSTVPVVNGMSPNILSQGMAPAGMTSHMPPSMSSLPSAPGMAPTVNGFSAATPSGMTSSMPGMTPTMPGMTSSMPGMTSSMPGMTPPMPGMPPSMPGMPPTMSGVTPSMPGMTPSMPGMSHGPPGPTMQGMHHGQIQGMPPTMHGMAPTMPGMPQAGPMGAPGQQQKRLDSNMMPSAVQVMEDDRKAHSGSFASGFPRAELPPLVTTDFACEDQGNCNPKFVRSTLYSGPVNSDLLKQSAIPFALTISPIAELDPSERPLPVVDMGDLGPVRCHRCKAYMCPYMEFTYGGRRFSCPFCKSTTEVPTEYFAHLDQNGQRTDLYERPELCLGSYEFVATKEYCKNNVYPKSPAFIFMLDVSYNSVRTGLMKLFCDNIKILLRNLPKELDAEKSSMKVGFATYDQSVHFYSLKSASGQPKMLIVNDVQDTFVPIVDGFLVDLHEAESAIDSLLTQIPQMFSESKITEVVLGPVVQSGMDALKASDRPGKLFIFHTSLPTYEATGKLKNRDDKQVIGTDKEKTLLLSQSEFYTKLAQECVGVGCCVDVFLFPNSYIDVATIGTMCGLTGGQVYKYQYFQPDIDGQRFVNDLQHDIERSIVFDAIIRVRTSTGIRPTDFFGNFYMQNTTDIELAAIDCDKCVTVEIKHDDKIEDQAVFFQVALLFTSVGGQRRLRIHNLSLNVGNDLPSLYRSADLFAVVGYLTKQGERLLLQKSARDVKENLVNRSAQILATYRQHCSPGSSLGQLVLPETMKLLPLMANCIMKHSAFSGGTDLSFDDRAWLMQNIPAMPLIDLVYYLYARILPVHETVEEPVDELPLAVRTAYENLLPTGAYLFENSVVIMLWIGSQISTQWIQDVFGVQSFAQINSDKHELPEKDNATSRFVRKIFQALQYGRTRYMKLYIVKQQDKLEPWFKKFMVEDRGADSSPSYVEFLCHIHKEIRTMLS